MYLQKYLKCTMWLNDTQNIMEIKNHGTLFKQNNPNVLFPLMLPEHHSKKS